MRKGTVAVICSILVHSPATRGNTPRERAQSSIQIDILNSDGRQGQTWGETAMFHFIPLNIGVDQSLCCRQGSVTRNLLTAIIIAASAGINFPSGMPTKTSCPDTDVLRQSVCEGLKLHVVNWPL